MQHKATLDPWSDAIDFGERTLRAPDAFLRRSSTHTSLNTLCGRTSFQDRKHFISKMVVVRNQKEVGKREEERTSGLGIRDYTSSDDGSPNEE